MPTIKKQADAFKQIHDIGADKSKGTPCWERALYEKGVLGHGGDLRRNFGGIWNAFEDREALSFRFNTFFEHGMLIGNLRCLKPDFEILACLHIVMVIFGFGEAQ